ncbi:MAG: 2-oxoglutarate dehydrogenase E1 subunit family protein, partial [Pseudomonadales bacterium]
MADSFMQRMRESSHLDGNNLAYVEALYEVWLEDPARVPKSWQDYFRELGADANEADLPHRSVIEYFERLGRNRLKARPARESTRVETTHQRLQMQVQDLVAAYRHRGHKRAAIDPLGLMERPRMPALDLAYHGLTPAHLEESFSPGSFQFGAPSARLSELIRALEETYCGSIGSEYMHIVDVGEQRWVQQRLESVRARPSLSPAEQRVILERLTAAEGLEKYLQGRFPGTKRFGLEGGESLIPLLHEALQRLGGHGVLESVIGMAHRGRLNVLV